MSRSKDAKALGSWLSKPLTEGGSSSLNASKTINTVSTGVSGGSLSNPSNHSSVSAEKSRHTTRSANSSRRSLLSMPEEFSMNAAPISPLHSPSCRSSRSKVTNGHLYPRVPEVSEHEEDILWEHPLQHDGIPNAANRSSLSSRSTPRRVDADIVLTQAVNKSPPRIPKKVSSTTRIPKAPSSGFTAPRSSRRTEYDLSSGLNPSSSSRHFVSPLPLQTKPCPSAKGGLGSVIPQSIVVQKQVPSSKSGLSSSDLRKEQGGTPDYRKLPPPQEIVLDNKFWQNQTKSKTSHANESWNLNRVNREDHYHDDGYDESMSRASSRLQGSCTSINYDQSDRFDESEASALAAQEEEMMLLALELSLADQNSSYQLDFNDSGDGCSLSVPSMRAGGVKGRRQKEHGQANLDSLASGKTYYVCIPQQAPAPGASVTSSSSKGIPLTPLSSQRETPLDAEAYCGDSVTSHRLDDRSFLGREDMTTNSEEEREMIELVMERSLHDGDSVSQLSRPEVLRRDVSLSTVYLRNDLGTSDGALSPSYAQVSAHESRYEPQPTDVSSSKSERSYYGHQNSTHSRDLLSDRATDDVSHGSRYSMRDVRWAAHPPSMRRVNGSSGSRQTPGAGGSSGHSRQASAGYLSGIDHEDRYRTSERSEPYRLDDDSEYQRIASYAQPASASKASVSSRHSSNRGGSSTTRPATRTPRGPPSSIGFYTPSKPPNRSSSPTEESELGSLQRYGSSSRQMNFTSLRAKFDKGNEGQLPDIVVRSTRPHK
jgi:hypothetical protein